MEQLDGRRWRKSSYSGNGGNDCVEVGTYAKAVVVRDTKDRRGAVLRFAPATWRTFADQLKADVRDIVGSR